MCSSSSLTKRARRIQEGCGSRKQLWWYGAPIQSGNPAAAAVEEQPIGRGRQASSTLFSAADYFVSWGSQYKLSAIDLRHGGCSATAYCNTATAHRFLRSTKARLHSLVGAGLCWGKCCRRGMCADKPMCTAAGRTSCCGEQKESQDTAAALLAIAAA